ncbi:unnamed protein product [Candidula unifasciata]|uniref:Uncharacterized protein n=1 Tax=Candidula unifasciata TaxID=100452 RepID=A0A8S3Z039_9EUPU|nr:unnamed protein product [Candidula unifasciata]
MDRRYSMQPIIRKDSKEEEEKKVSPYETNRRGSVAVTNFGKTRSWVKRSNLAPEHARPYPETRSSWDESMRRRDSDQGLRGIVLRKGFSDDSKNYSLFHTESRRASKVEPSFFYSGKQLCKWETVNLIGIKEKSTAEEAIAAVAGKRRRQTKLKVKIPSREDSGIEVASASTTSSALSSKFSHGYLDNVSESEERHDYYTTLELEVPCGSPGNLESPTLSRFGGQHRSNVRPPSRDFDSSERFSQPADRYPLEDSWSEESTNQDMTTGGQTRDSVPPYVRRDGPDERRPSIIPTLNITREQSNFEKFLNIISTNKDIPEFGPIGESSISRTKSCEMIRKDQDDDMSIWERRNRKAGDFSPGTRPIVLNIEAIDDSMCWSKSGCSTLVSAWGRSETYICKDDLHLSLRKLSIASGGDPRCAGLCANDGNRLGSGGDGGGRSGSKLRKPTNLWGVTRRISVKRKKVTKEEKKEEAPTEQNEEPPR